MVSSAATTTPTKFDWSILMKEKKEWSKEPTLVADLRSDHAGETGAVYIYKGAQKAISMRPEAFTPAAIQFVANHHATEQAHLDYFDKLMDDNQKSILLPLWRISGFALGFLPTYIAGEPGLYCTIEAVESFVELHYQEQIVPLQSKQRYPELQKLLIHCCEEEVHHKEDARDRWVTDVNAPRPWYANVWSWIVGSGSAGAVSVCKRI